MEIFPSPEGQSLSLREGDRGATSQTLLLKVFRASLGVQHLEKLLETGGIQHGKNQDKTPKYPINASLPSTPERSLLPHPRPALTASSHTPFGLGKVGEGRRRKHRHLSKAKLWLVLPPGFASPSFNPVQHLWNIPSLLLWSKCKYKFGKEELPTRKELLGAVAPELELNHNITRLNNAVKNT